MESIKYKGHYIDYNKYGTKEYTVPTEDGRDDAWFKDIENAKAFIDSMNERYVIGKDFNTKDWWVFDNELGLRICYFDTEEEAKEWVKRKTKGE